MRSGKRFFSVAIILAFMLQAYLPLNSFAVSQDTKPDGLDVKKTGGNYEIYDNTVLPKRKNHVVLTWNPTTFPGTYDSAGYKFYTSEDGASTSVPFPVKVSSTANPLQVELDANGDQDLKSGTIYNAKVTAYHIHKDSQTGVETEHESALSTASSISFMTDIAVEVKTAGTDAVEIKWDDVKYGGNRIGYDIYIKESKDFDSTPTVSVDPARDITSAGPVKPILAERKLSYTARGLKGGTIYYVKIVPKIDDVVRHNPETKVSVGFTSIVATATRLSDSWWRLEWNKVTNANLGQGEQILYLVKRGDSSAGNDQLPLTLGSTTDNKYYVDISDPKYYFYISASVKNQYGTTTTLESEHLRGIEADIPAKPPIPALQDIIMEDPSNRNSAVYEYVYAVTSTQAKIAWTPPKKADGTEDTDVIYDIWLLTDPDDLSNANAQKVKSNYSIPITNNIYGKIDKTKLLGYSYTFSDLTPNSVYYFKIVAKKLFTINNNGQLEQIYYESDPALRVIVTPTGGPIDQPSAPAKPPLKVKLTTDGKPDVGLGFVNIQWENRWWEAYRNGAWVYYPEGSYSSVADAVYRHVSYDSDVKFDIGYVEYPEGQASVNFDTIVRSNPTKINGIPNDTTSITQTYKIDNLNPNTKYIVWLKAHRQTGSLVSEPSDPVVVITKPSIPDTTERPTVPRFTYSKGGDTYVDLQWTSKTGYYYSIKYNTVDDIGTAQDAPRVTPADLQTSSVYRVKGLTPNKVYYFWIMADSTESTGDQEVSTSLWSDSVYQKTTPFISPETPKGFGIKDGENSIGKNSVTFEWIKETGLTYIIEIGTDINYKDAKEYKDISAEEYTATGLRSNLRYWARLYAYDPVKELRSDPTQSITIKTKRSDDDYDSDVDTDNVITGPFIEDDYSSGVWTLKIVGVNADRFVDKIKTDNILDYKIDLTNNHSGAKKRVLLVSNKVFSALSELKENINIDCGFSLYTIRPHVMDSDQLNQIAEKSGNVNLELTIVQQTTSYGTGDYTLNYEAGPADIAVNIISGTLKTPLKSFNNPLKVAFPYNSESLFSDGKVNGYTYDDANIKWVKQTVTPKFDKTLNKGYASFDLKAPGSAALLRKALASSAFYDIGGHPAETAINAVCSKFELPSLGTGYFKPNETITIGDASKLVMDVLGYKYGENSAEAAAKAGFISAADVSNTGKGCTKRQLQKMLDKLYEIKAGQKPSSYSGTSSDKLMTRGDAMMELYYTLTDLGEL